VSFHRDPRCQGSVSSERHRSPWLSRDNHQGSRPQCGLTGQSERSNRLPRSRVVHPREQASHPRDRGPSAQSANPQSASRLQAVIQPSLTGQTPIEQGHFSVRIVLSGAGAYVVDPVGFVHDGGDGERNRLGGPLGVVHVRGPLRERGFLHYSFTGSKRVVVGRRVWPRCFLA
jgi:hypothetical protein